LREVDDRLLELFVRAPQGLGKALRLQARDA